jgi:hypothetical protein
VTTFNVINMQEAVPVGKSTMGGAASPGLINSISSGLKAFLGGLFGSDTHTLATANLPPYTPAGTIATVLASAAGFLIRITGGNIYYGGASAGGADPVGTNPPTFTSTWTGTPQGGTSHANQQRAAVSRGEFHHPHRVTRRALPQMLWG